MSLLDVVRSAVSIANSVTKPLQASVQYKRYVSTSEYGVVTYAAVVTLKAIVDWKQKQVRTQLGQLAISRSVVTFIDIKALVSATSGLGVGDQDVITLPDGTTGPILDMSGFIDAGTGHPVATEVFLG